MCGLKQDGESRQSSRGPSSMTQVEDTDDSTDKDAGGEETDEKEEVKDKITAQPYKASLWYVSLTFACLYFSEIQFDLNLTTTHYSCFLT